MAMSKRKRRLEAQKKREARQFWRILFIVVAIILIILFISYVGGF